MEYNLLLVTKMQLTLPEIFEDLHAAERELQPYEKKYNMRSEFFYELFRGGFIEDAGNFDFQSWAGIYEIKIDREQLYKKFVLNQTQSYSS